MATTYTKTSTSGISGGALHRAILLDTTITKNVTNVEHDTTTTSYDITFDAALTAPEETALDGIMTGFDTGDPEPPAAETLLGATVKQVEQLGNNEILKFNGTSTEWETHFLNCLCCKELDCRTSNPLTTALTHDYDPTGFDNTIDTLLLDNTSGGVADITGIARKSPKCHLVVINASTVADKIRLMKEDTGSTAANRFHVLSNIDLEQNQAVHLYYSETLSKWLLISHL